MPTQLVCAICGQEFECNGQHEGSRDVLSPVVKCSVEQGGICVFVKDNRGKGVLGVKTYASGSTKTDDLGFALFEQLAEGSYPARIALDESDAAVQSSYYTITRTSVSAKVKPGEVTLVEFALIQYGTMLVILERTDHEPDLPRVSFEIGSAKHTPDEPRKLGKDGQAHFEKLKPTERYSVRCELHEDDRKNFKLEKAEELDQKVTSGEQTKVVFRVSPRFWVDLVLVDPADGALKGAFALRQAEDRASAKDVGGDVKHVPDLKSGTVDIEGVTLPESREFASLT